MAQRQGVGVRGPGFELRVRVAFSSEGRCSVVHRCVRGGPEFELPGAVALCRSAYGVSIQGAGFESCAI